MPFLPPANMDSGKNYSCETQLLLFTNPIAVDLDRGSFIRGVFLDFFKAFNKVPHKLLLLKMSTLKIDPNILKWIECFLSITKPNMLSLTITLPLLVLLNLASLKVPF